MHLKTYLPADQGPLSPGERLHDLRFLLPNGRQISLYDSRVFGRPAVLHFALNAEDAVAACARLVDLAGEFARLECQVYCATAASPQANEALRERLRLPFPVLSDADSVLPRALAGPPCGPTVQMPQTLVFDPILRLEARFGGTDVAAQCDQALGWVAARDAAQTGQVVTAQPPVLVLPHVLDPVQCCRLIRLWDSGQKHDGRVASDANQHNTVDRRAKVRADVALPEDSVECRDLLGALSRHLLPEVLKSFGFRVTRVETPRVGCYDACDGGHFAAHRDNTTRQTAYRRFAMSLNLNTGDYEGGHLRFPEFGPQLYAPDVGGAVVFCCTLLHRAMLVTKGRRFGLFAFFYGEEEELLRQRINAETGGGSS